MLKTLGPHAWRKIIGGARLLATLVVMFGIYAFFSSPSSAPPSPTPTSDLLNQQTPDEAPPPEPAYDPKSLPEIEVGQMVEFGIDRDNRALISGWSVPETGGVWSAKKNAAIAFVVRCRPPDCGADQPLLLFGGQVYVASGRFSQTIEAWIGRRKVDQATPTLPHGFAIELKGETLKDGAPLVLSLHLPNAIRVPDPADGRELAFRIARLTLEPWPSAPDAH